MNINISRIIYSEAKIGVMNAIISTFLLLTLLLIIEFTDPNY